MLRTLTAITRSKRSVATSTGPAIFIDTDIVVEDVDAAERIDARVDHAPNTPLIGNVGDVSDALMALAGNDFCGFG